MSVSEHSSIFYNSKSVGGHKKTGLIHRYSSIDITRKMGSLELRVFPDEPVGDEDLSQKVSGSGESGGLGGLVSNGAGGFTVYSTGEKYIVFQLHIDAKTVSRWKRRTRG